MFQLVKKDFIYSLIILALTFCLGLLVNRCSDVSSEYRHNIKALNDSIRYYQTSNGDLVATKLAYESDIKTLKSLNNDLYNQVQSLKSHINTATSFNGSINRPHQDTVWVIEFDTVKNSITRQFAFNDDYQILEGDVQIYSDTVALNINKNEVLFDFVVALSNDNNIMIKSTNPYVKYNEITGFQLPKVKPMQWSLDMFTSFNYNTHTNDRYADVGLLLKYKTSRLSFGPHLYYDYNLMTKDKAIYLGASLNLNIVKK